MPPSLPHVNVILALHMPNKRLLKIQLESYRRQVGVTTTLFAILDGEETCSDNELREQLSKAGATLIYESTGVGVRRAFLKGLAEALETTSDPEGLFAFMDQDDRWYEEKLSASASMLFSERAQLIHCDASVINEEGRLIAQSLHVLENRQHGGSLLGCILLNTVSGMSAVFTRAAAKLCLSLEQGLQSKILHDHLISIAASALGRIVFLDRVLLDYVSHGSNTVGPIPWRKRSLWTRRVSLDALLKYFKTTAEVFEDRQFIVFALKSHGFASDDLCQLFLIGNSPPNILTLFYVYLRAAMLLYSESRTRCAKWIVRFFPLALTRVRTH